jgi:hypothetical protein
VPKRFHYSSPLFSESKEIVVFDLYGAGNDGCTKKKVGTYQVSVDSFGKALLQQKMLEYYMTYGKEMKMDKNAINYFTCTQYYYNAVPVGFIEQFYVLWTYSGFSSAHILHSSLS